MVAVFAGAKRHRPETWATVNSAGEVLALLLPTWISVFAAPVVSRLTRRAVVYGGALTAGGETGATALGLLLQEYDRHARWQGLFTELRPIGQVGTAVPDTVLASAGYQHEDHLNFLIDLHQGQDRLWASIDKSAQKRIKRAIRLGARVVEWPDANTPSPIPRFYALVQETYAHVGVPLADHTLFMSAFRVLHPKGMFRLFAVEVEGRVIGVRAILVYKEWIHDWYAGADRSALSYCPNDLLVWHVLQWGAEHGLHWFDFGGAGRPDVPYGVRDFKAKFGGDLVHPGRQTAIHWPAVFALAQAGYQIYRRIKATNREGVTQAEVKHQA